MRKADINQYTGTPIADKAVDIQAVSTGKSVFSMIMKIILTSIIIIFISFMIVGVSVIAYVANNTNQSVNLDLRSLKIDLTSFIYVNNSDGVAEEYQPVYAGEQRVWVDYDNIPQYMKDAMVAIEDKRFYDHRGVDWVRTGGAVLNFFTGNDSYGGSTLTQQLIKNLTKKNQVSITRKVSEIVSALSFERKYTKDEILETYLNVVNFGSGCNGVQAAAHLYFGKDIADCSIAECASIAGITQNPAQYTPLIYPEQNKKRQQVVLLSMYDQNMITKAEYDQAMNDSEHMVFIGDTNENKVDNVPVNNWYIDAMLIDVANDLAQQLNIDEETANYMVMHNGLKIYSAMDKEAQSAAEEIMQDDSIMPWNQQIQVGYIMIDYEGRILASVGQRGPKQANLLWDCANGATRQPGSSFKPIGVYAPALEYNFYTYSSMLPDEPISGIPGTSGSWPPNWYGYYTGQMILQHAVEISANAPAAQVVKTMTPEKSFEFVSSNFEFKALNAEEDCTYSGMATGGSYNGVTVREMAAAFQIFGNGGVYNKAHTYFYVEDSSGKILLDNRTKPGSQVISSQNATIMRKLLQTVVTGAQGTGSAGKVPGFTTFAKTGTTDYNENSWYVGGTPYAAAGIWTGYETPTEMSNSESAYAAKIWREIMAKYLENKPSLEFDDDPDVLIRSYCTQTGCLASSGCPTATGYYSSDNLPSVCRSGHSSYNAKNDNNNGGGTTRSTTGGGYRETQRETYGDTTVDMTRETTRETYDDVDSDVPSETSSATTARSTEETKPETTSRYTTSIEEPKTTQRNTETVIED